MNIVIVGHVDHGKSTVIGRLLADTGSLPEGKLEQIKELCERNSKPFEYAFLLDALEDERSQGITIDAARIFFSTEKREYMIIDAPGHIEFLKNMVTGASHAEAALLVIDAEEGVQENSRRHGYMLSMLGIEQVAVVINKMDLVNYDEAIYNGIVKEYRKFLTSINVEPHTFIPVSGLFGDCIAGLSDRMAWYKDSTVLEVLDQFREQKDDSELPFRMPVQDVYKFTRYGDKRRIVAGTIQSGQISKGDEVVFYPSGKRSRIKSIETFPEGNTTSQTSPNTVGFTLEEQIYITRGEVAARATEEKPCFTTRIKVHIFWLSKHSMEQKKNYVLKLGTSRVNCRLEEVTRLIDASTLSVNAKAEKLERHAVAECILSLKKEIAFDLTATNPKLSRFVLVDNYRIAGGGIISESLADTRDWVREKVQLRNYKWERSMILPNHRAEKYNQRSTLMLITGPSNAGKKPIAKALESRLFDDGKMVYFLGISNVLYGIDADIKKNGGSSDEQRKEHIRRLAEVAHIMLDSGMILIVTAVGLTQSDLETIKMINNPDLIETVWVGEEVTTDITYDLIIDNPGDIDGATTRLKEFLQDRGIIFKAW
jgi:bifunctional enzyme CysN/CysC